MGAGHGQLLGLLEEIYTHETGESGVTQYSKFLSALNVILAYVKFIQTYAALEIKLSAESGTLVRTLNSNPGGRKNLKARVVLNIGNIEGYNCVRLGVLTMFGADYSTFTDGPLENAGVVWHLDQGGGSDMYHNGTRG